MKVKYELARKRILEFAKNLLPEHAESLPAYLNEYYCEVEKFVELEKLFGKLSYYDFINGANLYYNPLFYALARALKPELVVETGVAAGLGSAGWLEAMNKNQKGRLISFDLPPSVETDDYKLLRYQIWKYRPHGTTSGWAIPSYLRARWELIPGNSLEECRNNCRSWC